MLLPVGVLSPAATNPLSIPTKTCCPCDDTHLSSTAEAGHSVTLAQVVEARLGELSGGYDGERPGVEGVQAVLLSAHVGIVTCWSLVGHILYTTRAKWAGGWWGREAHV